MKKELRFVGWKSTIIYLKPFDQRLDENDFMVVTNNVCYATIQLSSACAMLSALVFMFLPSSDLGLVLITLCIGFSAVLSGFEWHLGLTAMALNNLLFVVVMTFILLSINTF